MSKAPSPFKRRPYPALVIALMATMRATTVRFGMPILAVFATRTCMGTARGRPTVIGKPGRYARVNVLASNEEIGTIKIIFSSSANREKNMKDAKAGLSQRTFTLSCTRSCGEKGGAREIPEWEGIQRRGSCRRHMTGGSGGCN